MTARNVTRGARWNVTVDAETCTGSALCQGIAPRHFELGADRRSRPRASEVEPDDAVADAAACCPMEAIRVVDAATGKQIAPSD